MADRGEEKSSDLSDGETVKAIFFKHCTINSMAFSGGSVVTKGDQNMTQNKWKETYRKVQQLKEKDQCLPKVYAMCSDYARQAPLNTPSFQETLCEKGLIYEDELYDLQADRNQLLEVLKNKDDCTFYYFCDAVRAEGHAEKADKFLECAKAVRHQDSDVRAQADFLDQELRNCRISDRLKKDLREKMQARLQLVKNLTRWQGRMEIEKESLNKRTDSTEIIIVMLNEVMARNSHLFPAEMKLKDDPCAKAKDMFNCLIQKIRAQEMEITQLRKSANGVTNEEKAKTWADRVTYVREKQDHEIGSSLKDCIGTLNQFEKVYISPYEDDKSKQVEELTDLVEEYKYALDQVGEIISDMRIEGAKAMKEMEENIRRECKEEMANMEKRHDAKLADMQKKHDDEMAHLKEYVDKQLQGKSNKEKADKPKADPEAKPKRNRKGSEKKS